MPTHLVLRRKAGKIISGYSFDAASDTEALERLVRGDMSGCELWEGERIVCPMAGEGRAEARGAIDRLHRDTCPLR